MHDRIDPGESRGRLAALAHAPTGSTSGRTNSGSPVPAAVSEPPQGDASFRQTTMGWFRVWFWLRVVLKSRGAAQRLKQLVSQLWPPREDESDDPSAVPAASPSRRPSATATSAAFASIVFHLGFFALLASLASDPVRPVAVETIDSRLLDQGETSPDPEEPAQFELADPNDKEYAAHEAADATSVGQVRAIEPRIEPVSVLDFSDNVDPGLGTVATYGIPQGVEIDDRIAVKGTTGEAVVQIEAALDRVSWEIANHLLERKLLVVWLLDASGSLKGQRAAVAARLRRIYGELGALEEAGRVAARAEKSLLSGVVMYGERTLFVTPEPTDRFEVVHEAVQNAPTDPSGVENVFGAVEQVVHRWQKFRTAQGRGILLIVVTDETGDDFERLELAILACKRYGARAYVIGPAAVFGRRQAFVPYVAPEDHKTYQLPVDLGPESFALELPALPFWFSPSQYEFLSSGMGPYGLSRLVHETGGVYFLTEMTTSAVFAPVGAFDQQFLKAFEPDYRFGTPQEYINDVNRHRLRQAVMRAAELSEKYKPKATPMLELRVTPQNYLQQLTDAQKSAAETSYAVDNLLAAFVGDLEPEYEKEASLRWRANYDLARGRLLALRVRAQEYNLACAQLKQLGTPDVANKSNHWFFRPSKQFVGGAATRKVAAEAARLLKRVLDEAPNTPWEKLAERELSVPFGIEVVQKYDPPPKPAPQKPGNGAPAKPAKRQVQLADDAPKKKKPDAPPPPPKLPKL